MEKQPDWQLSVEGVRAKAALARELDKYTDVTFQVGDENEIIKAHRFMLCLASPVFEAMLYGSMANDNPIIVSDIQPEVFQAVLGYIYTDQFQYQNVDQILLIWYAALKYCIEILVDKCVAELIKKIDQGNVPNILNQAIMYDSEKLLDACWEFLSLQMTFNNQFFKKLHVETLQKVLDLDRITYGSEVDFFNGLNKWAEDECDRKELEKTHENLRTITTNMIKKIRFLTIEPELFAKTVAASKLLTGDEKFSLMTNVFDKIDLEQIIQMPEGFSTNLVPRTPSEFLDEHCQQLTISRSFCSVGELSAGSTATITITSPTVDIQVSFTGPYYKEISMKIEEILKDKCQFVGDLVSDSAKYHMKANHTYRITGTALATVACSELYVLTEDLIFNYYDARGHKRSSNVKLKYGSVITFLHKINVTPASYA